MTDETTREHLYYAEGVTLSGQITLPFAQEICPQSALKLPQQGGYRSQAAGNYRLEGVISYQSAYTQVAGNRDQKPGHGWTTVATSVIEHLNVLEVVTADRVVAQISTEHPLIGYVPSVTFLGTRFENLRIAGHPVKLDLDLGILGQKPENDKPYSNNTEFVGRVNKQYEKVRHCTSLSEEKNKLYHRTLSSSQTQTPIECSLVNQGEGAYPGQSFGHVIDIPRFGKVFLGLLRLEESDFVNGIPKKTLISLTMIHLEMGCIAAGRADAGSSIINGATQP
jgi:hypothetical protein